MVPQASHSPLAGGGRVQVVAEDPDALGLRPSAYSDQAVVAVAEAAAAAGAASGAAVAAGAAAAASGAAALGLRPSAYSDQAVVAASGAAAAAGAAAGAAVRRGDLGFFLSGGVRTLTISVRLCFFTRVVVGGGKGLLDFRVGDTFIFISRD